MRRWFHVRRNHPIVALALRIVASALSFVFGIIAARYLGIEGFGVISVLLGFVNIGVVFALLGHETLATRAVASLSCVDAKNRESEIMTYSCVAARHVWMAGIVLLAVSMSAVSFMPISQQAGVEFLPLLLLIPIVARARLSQGLIRGTHRASLSYIPDGIVRPGLTVVALAASIIQDSKTSYGFVVVMITCSLVGLIVGLALERRALATLPQGVPGTSANTESARDQHFSMPIFVSSLLAVLVSQTPLISIGMLLTPGDAGLYAAAERFSLAAALIGQAVYLAVASRVAALYTSGETRQLRALLRKITRAVSGATLMVCLVLGAAAGPLLTLYGHSFTGAVSILQIMLVSVFCNVCAGPTGQVLLMTKNEKDHLMAMLISLLTQVALIIALVPAYGIQGAAWAVVFSTLVWNGVMMYYIHRRLSINPILAWA